MRAAEWSKAVTRAEQYLAGLPISKDGEVSIYTWATNPADKPRLRSIGQRVAEVSFWWPTSGGCGSGSSFMQVDVPWGACVCLLAERLIIAYAENWPAEEIAEEEERLAYALKGEK